MLNISCNLLNTALKVKNTVVVWVQNVVHPHDHVAALCCRKMGPERMVMSQVLGESLGWAPSEGPWFRSGKNSRAVAVK